MFISRIIRRRAGAGVVMLAMAAAALVSAGPAPTTAPDTTGPGIIRKFIEATGGADTYSKVKTRVTTGTIAMAPQGVGGDITIYQKAPDLIRVTGSVGGVTFDRGFDGHVAFDVNSMQGPRLLEGAEREFVEQQALASPLLNLDQNYQSIENLGVDQVDGRDAYKLELTTKSGQKFAEWYDSDSGLLVQMHMSLDSPMGKIEVLMNLTDWKEFGGFKLPTKMKQVIQPFGIEQNFEFTKFENNVEIPADKFELPEEVKDLVKATATTQPSTTQPSGGK
jgi:hypothetical protein